MEKEEDREGTKGYRGKGKGLKVPPLFIVLHAMQTRSSDENSVCPSVCLSVRPSVRQTRDL